MAERERRARSSIPLWSGVVLVAAVFVVAIASRAHRLGSGGGASSGSGDLLAEYAAVAAVVLMPIGALVVLGSLMHRRHKQLLAGKATRRRSLAGVVVFGLVLALVTLVLPRIHRVEPVDKRRATQTRTVGGPTTVPTRARPHRGGGTGGLPLLIGVALLIGFIGAAAFAIYAERRRPDAEGDDAMSAAAALAAVLDDALDDLRSERDPRKAVIRAYARMETTFAAYGLAREPAEAPLEYLERVLESVHASAESVRRLTVLYERAKFSEHMIATEMKEEAIEALVALRQELRGVPA